MPSSDAREALRRQNELPIGTKPGNNLLEEYVLTISEGSIAELLPDSQQGAPSTATTEGKALAQRANAKDWTPQGSKSKIIRKGSLNCRSGVCYLVLDRM